jgi:hypothetical protein
MTDDLHRSREAAALAEAQEGLVDLLVTHVERAYDAGGQAGAVAALRALFHRMDPAARSALVYELELETEPAQDEMGDQR